MSERMPAIPLATVREPTPSFLRSARKALMSATRIASRSAIFGGAAEVARQEGEKLPGVAAIGLDRVRGEPAFVGEEAPPALDRGDEVRRRRHENPVLCRSARHPLH